MTKASCKSHFKLEAFNSLAAVVMLISGPAPGGLAQQSVGKSVKDPMHVHRLVIVLMT